jgi:hypothetical protein
MTKRGKSAQGMGTKIFVLSKHPRSLELASPEIPDGARILR